ncbi:MAG: glycosyltransferase [Candidatus Omnitrophica bacterium]|nr:glycosyltransferase [Candidatus Omnitrophota bacterium]
MSVDKPRVSVLMTIYNAAPFLRESLDSLLAQTFLDWELIAVENGSTDESPLILASYTDPRIKVVALEKNIGRTPGLRHAFDQARSEYAAILDADDVALPGRFARQVDFLDSHPDTVLVGTWAQQINEKSRVFNTWEPPVDPDALHECLGWIDPIVHSSAMFRLAAAVKAGGYPEAYVYSQDFALILALAKRGRLGMIGEHLCKVRIFPGTMSCSSRYQMEVVREGLLLMRHAGRILPLSKKAQCRNRCSVAKYEIRCGLALYRRGDRLLGLKMILLAFVHAPSLVWNNSFFRPRFYL